jgi:hypothetical protein
MSRARLRWAAAELEMLPDRGLAHSHVRLVGHGALARIPKQSQMGHAPAANLAHQAACFERSAASGHTPALLGVLSPCAALPRGALIVEEIIGRPAQLPGDVTAIVTALASLHRLPLPAQDARAPLTSAADPLVDLLLEIEAQAAYLDAAQLDPAARRGIDVGIEHLRSVCALPPRPPRCLISFDAHPGNFMLRTDGRAMLVDLEKCRYGSAPLDLAHATLYTSTTWDAGNSGALGVDEVAKAYVDWSREMGASAIEWDAWHLPLRRAMWLWSITWCAKWRVVSRAASPTTVAGEDWSAGLSDPALIAHVRGRVDHYLGAPTVERMLDEIDAFGQTLPTTALQDAVIVGPHP